VSTVKRVFSLHVQGTVTSKVKGDNYCLPSEIQNKSSLMTLHELSYERLTNHD